MHTLFLEAATEIYFLKKVFNKTKQSFLKVTDYKTANFVKLNSSRVIFIDF